MLVARDISAREAFAMALRNRELTPRDGSRRSHIHGSNRNRIALHVMLNGRRNRTLVIVDLHLIFDTEPRIVTGQLWCWPDVGENGKNELVREIKNCKNGMGWINFQSKELIRGRTEAGLGRRGSEKH